MSEQSTSAPERPLSPAPDAITFTVKANNDTKFSLSLPLTTTIADVKQKLAELSEVPADRQRLIYSGRVMKNEETLETYKVKSGNTVHMVKGAASNAAASSGSVGGATPSGVPRNLASGSGNNPLAGLTGARYAGHVQLPSADIFGPDGGMGPPPDPEGIAQAMSNPAFQAQMNEMLQNPQLLDYIIASNPVLQSMGPSARQLMQSDLFRQMVTDPNTIRQMASMGAGVSGLGGQPAFPAPGATDNTPVPEGQQASSPQPQAQQQLVNPFASLFGSGPGGLGGLGGFSGANQGAQPNPTALNAFLGGLYGPPSAVNPTSPPPQGGQQQQQQQQPPPLRANPFLNPNLQQMQQMLQMLQTANPVEHTPFSGSPPNNPFMGLFAGMPPPAAPSPPDNRPPEERYADQLRQLNDMGFFDFDQNIAALRRSGGSVQGAVNQLLGG